MMNPMLRRSDLLVVATTTSRASSRTRTRGSQQQEEASVASGFKFKNYWGVWQNDFDSMQASQMVLRVFLTDDLSHPRPLWTWMAGIAVPDAQELARASANAPTLALIQGSASTPAQGGKGSARAATGMAARVARVAGATRAAARVAACAGGA